MSFGVYLPKLRGNLAPPSSGWMEAASSAENSITVPDDTASLCMLGRHGIKMETESSDESSVNIMPDKTRRQITRDLIFYEPLYEKSQILQNI